MCMHLISMSGCVRVLPACWNFYYLCLQNPRNALFVELFLRPPLREYFFPITIVLLLCLAVASALYTHRTFIPLLLELWVVGHVHVIVKGHLKVFCVYKQIECKPNRLLFGGMFFASFFFKLTSTLTSLLGRLQVAYT